MFNFNFNLNTNQPYTSSVVNYHFFPVMDPSEHFQHLIDFFSLQPSFLHQCVTPHLQFVNMLLLLPSEEFGEWDSRLSPSLHYRMEDTLWDITCWHLHSFPDFACVITVCIFFKSFDLNTQHNVFSYQYRYWLLLSVNTSGVKGVVHWLSIAVGLLMDSLYWSQCSDIIISFHAFFLSKPGAYITQNATWPQKVQVRAARLKCKLSSFLLHSSLSDSVMSPTLCRAKCSFSFWDMKGFIQYVSHMK